MIIRNARIYAAGKFVSGSMEFSEKIEAILPDVRTGTEGTGRDVGKAAFGERLPKPTAADSVIDEAGGIIDAGGCYVIPGLIDIHTHGGAGQDAGDGDAEGLLALSRFYASEGVTGWCPTTATLREDALYAAVKTAGAFVRPADGAKLAGFNLEGPFLSPDRAGAQDPLALHLPDISYFRKINEASGGIVRLVSVAPELPGAMEFIREVSQTATVSLGHTNAGYDICREAFENGASHITHAYNCMPGIHHREPGTIPAALEAGVTAELIPDGHHIHPAVVRMTAKLFGSKLCFITDSLRCAGMPDGDYTLGDQEITKTGGRAVLTKTLPGPGEASGKAPTLAGSVISLMEGIRRAVSFGVSLEDAVHASTIVPARVIGREREIGSLAKGKAADFVILDEALFVKAVYINGGCVYAYSK